jgi:hypothetical protein
MMSRSVFDRITRRAPASRAHDPLGAFAADVLELPHQPAAEAELVRELLVEVQPAHAAATVQPDAREGVVGLDLDALLELDVDVVPGIGQVVEPSAHAVVPAVHGAAHLREPGLELDLGIHQREDPVDVLRVERVDETRVHLDVRTGHGRNLHLA